MEIVKLKVLPTSHVGPVMPEPGAGPELTYPKGMVPYTMSCVRMAYHQGTLYADLPPATWASIDQDRAAALGYGPREAWPVNPKRAPPADLPMLKPGPVTQYLIPKTNNLMADRLRENKIANLIERLGIDYRLITNPYGLYVQRTATGKDTVMAYAVFDSLDVSAVHAEIRHRLK